MEHYIYIYIQLFSSKGIRQNSQLEDDKNMLGNIGNLLVKCMQQVKGDVKIPKMWSATCRCSWEQVVTEKSVTSDTLIVMNHHSSAVKSW